MRSKKRNHWDRNKKTNLNQKLLLVSLIVFSIFILIEIYDQDLGLATSVNSLFDTPKEIGQGLIYFFNEVISTVGNGITGAEISVGALEESISNDSLDLVLSGENLSISAANSSYCGTVSANLNLTQDINSSQLGFETCFIINANNIILDCKGYKINSSGRDALNAPGDDTAFGVDMNGKTNITIRNCIVSNFGAGISNNFAENLTVYNNTFYNLTNVGVSFKNGNYTNITNNVIDTTITNSFDYGGIRIINDTYVDIIT